MRYGRQGRQGSRPHIVYSNQDSAHNIIGSSEDGPLGQILESERLKRKRHPVLADPLMETGEHNRLTHPTVGLGCGVGFLQDLTSNWTLFVTLIAFAILYLNTGS